MGLFVCPGVCEGCSEKSCPMRGEVDANYKKELSAGLAGKIMLLSYEKMKEMITPERVANAMVLEIKEIIAKFEQKKNRLEALEVTDLVDTVYSCMQKIFLEGRDFTNINVEFIPKRFHYCAEQIAKPIERLLKVECEELFCGNCHILLACQRSSMKKTGNKNNFATYKITL